jgi:hypothetical protein
MEAAQLENESSERFKAYQTPSAILQVWPGKTKGYRQ